MTFIQFPNVDITMLEETLQLLQVELLTGVPDCQQGEHYYEGCCFVFWKLASDRSLLICKLKWCGAMESERMI